MAKRLDDIVNQNGIELVLLKEDDLASLRQDNLLARGLAQWAAARDCLAETGGQMFLPFFDHVLFGAAVDRRPVRGQISGIVFRPPNSHNLPKTLRRRVGTARRWGTYLAARRPAVRRMFTLDELAAQSAISRPMGLLKFLPDPTPDMSLLSDRKQRPRADGRRSYLLFGSLGARKGIFTTLDALAHLPEEARKGVALRFVGRALPQERDEFCKRLARARADHPEIVIEWVEDFVDDSTLAQEVTDCDVVMAPYQNHIGSSGVMFWANSAGKPLIGQHTGLIGYQLKHYNLGLAVDTTDPRALAHAMITVEARPSNAVFLRAHSPEAFNTTILDSLFSDPLSGNASTKGSLS
ncbi:glycosyltransferase [Leisingera sp. D0M16]|uniref:glycosyltransferase n=1 Tax=Leisingera coralii TaxID=3351347 RepID=UPI003B78D876